MARELQSWVAVAIWPSSGTGPRPVRFDWGPSGAQALAAGVDVLVIVDVLSFTTSVEVAVARGGAANEESVFCTGTGRTPQTRYVGEPVEVSELAGS